MPLSYIVAKNLAFLYPCPETFEWLNLEIVDWFVWQRGFQGSKVPRLQPGCYWLLLVSFYSVNQQSRKTWKICNLARGKMKPSLFRTVNGGGEILLATEISSGKREPCVKEQDDGKKKPGAFQRSLRLPLLSQVQRPRRTKLFPKTPALDSGLLAKISEAIAVLTQPGSEVALVGSRRWLQPHGAGFAGVQNARVTGS